MRAWWLPFVYIHHRSYVICYKRFLESWRLSCVGLLLQEDKLMETAFDVCVSCIPVVICSDQLLPPKTPKQVQTSAGRKAYMAWVEISSVLVQALADAAVPNSTVQCEACEFWRAEGAGHRLCVLGSWAHFCCGLAPHTTATDAMSRGAMSLSGPKAAANPPAHQPSQKQDRNIPIIRRLNGGRIILLKG